MTPHPPTHGTYLPPWSSDPFTACNSANALTVASGFDIDIVRSALVGDELTARAVAAHQGGRSGVYDTRVTDQSGKLVALFRGKSATIKGQFIETSTTGRSRPLITWVQRVMVISGDSHHLRLPAAGATDPRI